MAEGTIEYALVPVLFCVVFVLCHVLLADALAGGVVQLVERHQDHDQCKEDAGDPEELPRNDVLRSKRLIGNAGIEAAGGQEEAHGALHQAEAHLVPERDHSAVNADLILAGLVIAPFRRVGRHAEEAGHQTKGAEVGHKRAAQPADTVYIAGEGGHTEGKHNTDDGIHLTGSALALEEVRGIGEQQSAHHGAKAEAGGEGGDRRVVLADVDKVVGHDAITAIDSAADCNGNHGAEHELLIVQAGHNVLDNTVTLTLGLGLHAENFLGTKHGDRADDQTGDGQNDHGNEPALGRAFAVFAGIAGDDIHDDDVGEHHQSHTQRRGGATLSVVVGDDGGQAGIGAVPAAEAERPRKIHDGRPNGSPHRTHDAGRCAEHQAGEEERGDDPQHHLLAVFAELGVLGVIRPVAPPGVIHNIKHTRGQKNGRCGGSGDLEAVRAVNQEIGCEKQI